MMPLTHHEQSRHAELFFPVVMMNCADRAIWVLLGPMAHIFLYIACQDLSYNFCHWVGRGHFFFSFKKMQLFHSKWQYSRQNEITKRICSSHKCLISCWEPFDLLIISSSFIHESVLVSLYYDWPHVNQIRTSCILHAFLSTAFWPYYRSAT